jgi:hypothetical protein
MKGRTMHRSHRRMADGRPAETAADAVAGAPGFPSFRGARRWRASPEPIRRSRSCEQTALSACRARPWRADATRFLSSAAAYGFRARRCAAPRNDGRGESPPAASSGIPGTTPEPLRRTAGGAPAETVASTVARPIRPPFHGSFRGARRWRASPEPIRRSASGEHTALSAHRATPWHADAARFPSSAAAYGFRARRCAAARNDGRGEAVHGLSCGSGKATEPLRRRVLDGLRMRPPRNRSEATR